MSHIADRFVVILDSNVLYPFRKRDTLLRFYQAGLFRARWTEQIMEEWTSRLLEKNPHLKQSIHQQGQAMRSHFDEAWVKDFESLIDGISLPDPDDRHVLAAAIKCGAQHIVTENLKDFPPETLIKFDIEAIEADEFLSRTFDLYTSNSLQVISRMRTAYDNPSYTPSEFLLDLTAKGMPKLAAKLRTYRGII